MIPETINFYLATWFLISILILLTLVIIKLNFCSTLLETIINSSIVSLLISLAYLLMDAPDVAMTEIALGSCLSSCVLLSFLSKLPKTQKYHLTQTRLISSSIIYLVFIIVFTLLGTELPEYGANNSPLQNHLTKYYIQNTKADIGISSFVAAILASYRGYDTFGETIVILIAGISVLLLLSKKVQHV